MRVGSHSLFQGIFPTQGLNPGLLHCRRILYQLSHQGSPWCVYVCMTVTQLCLTLCDPTDCSPSGSSVHEFSRQEYWSGLPFPAPGYLPNPGIEPGSPALQPDSLPSEPQGKPYFSMCLHTKEKTHVISISKSTEARRAIKNQILQLMTLDSNSICSSWLEVDVTVPD